MMPIFFSKSSMPVYLERFHSPSFSAELAWGMWRARLRMWPTVSSAAETMLEVGALTTMTPACVADLMSTLSSPTPARAMTLRFFAAAMASASTWVAERTRIASTSAMADSSWERSAPSIWRISKSGPNASTVAGESSSARRTTGLVADTGWHLTLDNFGTVLDKERMRGPDTTPDQPRISNLGKDSGAGERCYGPV